MELPCEFHTTEPDCTFPGCGTGSAAKLLIQLDEYWAEFVDVKDAICLPRPRRLTGRQIRASGFIIRRRISIERGDAAALAEPPLAHLRPLGSIASIPQLARSFDPDFWDTPPVRDLVLVVEAGHRVRLALALERLRHSIEEWIRPNGCSEGGRAKGSAAETPPGEQTGREEELNPASLPGERLPVLSPPDAVGNQDAEGNPDAARIGLQNPRAATLAGGGEGRNEPVLGVRSRDRVRRPDRGQLRPSSRGADRMGASLDRET